MKWIKITLACVSVIGGATAGPVLAQHSHHGPRFGVYISPGWGGHYSYTYPPVGYYAYPPVVVVPAGPPEYIEHGQTPAPMAQGQPAADYWYYCTNPAGYYPYIQQCPGGWQKVAPRPPSQ